MKCLTIKQPWAYLIMAGIKDIENRSWKTSIRGRILIHASKEIDMNAVYKHKDLLPTIDQLQVGAILGSVEIVDCITGKHPSPWKEEHSSYGFVLKDPVKLLKPWPYRGNLRFFDVNAENLINEALPKAVWVQETLEEPRI